MNYSVTCNCKLAALMRTAIPVPGTDYKNLIVVEMKRGERIGRHKHLDHTALHYPADSSSVIVTPIAGMTIYLPPATYHEVPASKDDPRLSIAMLVEPVIPKAIIGPLRPGRQG